MNLTIDYLLSELNEVALKASIDELRTPIMFDVREVLRRIGLESIGIIVEEQIDVINHIYKIPDRIAGIDDIGFRQGNYEGRKVAGGGRYSSQLDFTQDIRGLFFPNLSSGKVWIRAYQFYLDEEGAPLLPEEAYTACYDYCKSKIVFTMPTSPHWPDRWALKDTSYASIRSARGHFNETSNSSLRENRR